MSAGFTIIRNVRDDTTYSKSTKHLLMLLATYADATGRARPSVNTLAQCLGLKRRQVHYRLAELVDDGYLIAEKRTGMPTTYVFRDAHIWLHRPSLGLVQGGAS